MLSSFFETPTIKDLKISNRLSHESNLKLNTKMTNHSYTQEVGPYSSVKWTRPPSSLLEFEEVLDLILALLTKTKVRLSGIGLSLLMIGVHRFSEKPSFGSEH